MHKDTGLCRTTIKECLETLNKLNIVKSIRGRSGKTYVVNEVFLRAEKLYEPTQIAVVWMSVCVCVCVCVCVHAKVQAALLPQQRHLRGVWCACVCVRACASERACVWICVYMCVHAKVQAALLPQRRHHRGVCVCMRASAHVWMRVCVCISHFVWNTCNFFFFRICDACWDVTLTVQEWSSLKARP